MLRCSHVAVANHTTQVFNFLGSARGEGCTVPSRPDGVLSDPEGRGAPRPVPRLRELGAMKQMKIRVSLGGVLGLDRHIF